MKRPNKFGSKTFVINMASCVAYRLLQISVLAWVNQYLLKRIPAEEYSIYPLMLSLIVFAGFFKSIFTSGIARFLVEADSKGDENAVTRITSSMFPVLLAAATTIVVAGFVCASRIDSILDIDKTYVTEARLMLVMLAVMMGFDVATTPFSSGLYIRHRFITINLIDLFTEIFRVALLLALLLGVGPNVIWLVVASVTGSFATTLCNLIATRRELPSAKFDRKLVSGAQMKAVMSFSAWSCTEGFSGVAAKSLPILFLNRLAGAADVTIFHLANLVDLQVKRLLAAAMRPAMPALTAMHGLGMREELRKIYYSGGRYHLWAILLPAAALYVFGADFMELYAGAEYRNAGYVVIAFFLRYPISYASAMYYRISHATGKVRTYYLMDMGSQFLLVSTFYVSLKYGDGGVVAAMWWVCAVQSAYHMFVAWPLGLRLINGNWPEFFQTTIVPGMLPVVVSVAYCLALRSFVVPNSWPEMFFACVSGTIVNFSAIVLVACKSSDRHLAQRVAGKMWGQWPSLLRRLRMSPL